jgi:hypothetical protein
MIRKHSLLLASLAAVATTACDRETGPTTPDLGPAAATRYVHAVPDTGAMDWRPIDRLEDSPPALGLSFREATSYMAMGAGSRRLRIFPASDNIDVTSKFLIDQTISFAENQHYTLIHTGRARTGETPEDEIWVVEDDPIPQPSTAAGAGGRIALRVIHAGLGEGNLDIFVTASAADPLPAQPTFSNVAYKTESNYTELGTGPLVIRATAAGTRTPVLFTVTAPAGVPGSATLDPEPGSTIAGSVLTAVIMPRGVAGPPPSPNAGVTNPTAVFLHDRRVPRP